MSVARRDVSGFEREGCVLTSDHEAARARILDIMRSQVQDKSVFFDLDTSIEGVKIDSIDIIQVLFKVEEEFNTHVELPLDAKYEKIGDFVEAMLTGVGSRGKAS